MTNRRPLTEEEERSVVPAVRQLLRACYTMREGVGPEADMAFSVLVEQSDPTETRPQGSPVLNVSIYEQLPADGRYCGYMVDVREILTYMAATASFSDARQPADETDGNVLIMIGRLADMDAVVRLWMLMPPPGTPKPATVPAFRRNIDLAEG